MEEVPKVSCRRRNEGAEPFCQGGTKLAKGLADSGLGIGASWFGLPHTFPSLIAFRSSSGVVSSERLKEAESLLPAKME